MKRALLLYTLFILSCEKSYLPGKDELLQKTESWSSQRIEKLTAPYGWLSLVGFNWLDGSANNRYNFDVINGTFIVNKDSVFYQTSVDSTKKLVYLFDKDTIIQERIYRDSKQFYIVERDSKFALRVKDSLADSRINFRGIERFPFNPEMIFEAKLYILDIPKEFILPNKMGYEQKETIKYRMDFKHDGEKKSLYPIKEGDQFFVIFADPTNGESTYSSCRYLYTSLPDSSGRIILNFNKSYNPPCAFTDFATCPLPPKENYLDFKIEAGEKNYKN